MPNEKETIVVGAGLAGLTTAHLLSNLGFHVTLLEKSTEIGGISNSFQDEKGNTFDYGYHALDYNRSVVTTDFFQKILGNQYRKIKLQRAIVLENQVIPYNAPREHWPEPFREKLSEGDLVDNIPPKPVREDFYRAYGRWFTDLIFEKTVASYPTLRWHLKNGKTESEILDLIHPWFFPRSRKLTERHEEWNQYHDKMRAGSEQYILYPTQGGFGELLNQMLAQTNKKFFDLRSGVKQLDFEVNAESQSIEKIIVDGETLVSNKIYWCAPLTILSKLFSIPLPALFPQELILGSFAFSSEVNMNYHEILVGDPQHLINRISTPGKIAGQKNHLIQVEYLFPSGEYEFTKEQWRQKWLESLKQLGLLQESNAVTAFDHKAMKKGFLATLAYSEIIDLFKSRLSHPHSNVIYPFWGVGPENMNRLIPSVIDTVTKSVSRVAL